MDPTPRTRAVAGEPDKVAQRPPRLFLSALARPEPKPVENVWQYLRANWLSSRVFKAYDAIIDAACEAWMKLIALPEPIASIGMREWAHIRSIAVTPGMSG